jgi:hypothetical protein
MPNCAPVAFVLQISQDDKSIYAVSESRFCDSNSTTDHERDRTMIQIDYASLDYNKLSAAQIAAIHDDVKARTNELRREAIQNFWNAIFNGLRRITIRFGSRKQRETPPVSRYSTSH